MYDLINSRIKSCDVELPWKNVVPCAWNLWYKFANSIEKNKTLTYLNLNLKIMVNVKTLEPIKIQTCALQLYEDNYL